MAERIGTVAIKDALVTLIGTTAVSDLNNGLTNTVKKVYTGKPDEAVIQVSMFPAICIWIGQFEADFRGASKRKEVKLQCEIHFWTRNMVSVDASIDDAQNLSDNIIYIIDSNVQLAGIGNGFMKVSGLRIEYRTADSGFVAHGVVTVEITKYLN